MNKYSDCNITVFGDSIALGCTLNNLVPARLAVNAISVISEKINCEINNCSVFGQTLKRVSRKETIERYIEENNNKRNSVAVIALGGNDSDYHWETVADSPDAPHDCKTNLKEFSSLLDRNINMLSENGIMPVLVNLVPVDSKNYFENVLSRKYSGEKLLRFFNGDISIIYRHQEAFSNEIIKAAIKNNCKLLDIRSKLLWHRDLKGFMHTDGVHLNEKGQLFIAEEICNMIAI